LKHYPYHNKKQKRLDNWLISKMHEYIRKSTHAMDAMELREATTLLFFQFYDNLRWYTRRGGAHKAVIKEVLENWIKMICPIVPHTAEEIWERLGNKSLISTEEWPSYDEEKIDLLVESQEKVLENIIGDIRSVIKLSKIAQPKETTLFIAPQWKFDLFRELKKQIEVTRDVGQIMREIMRDENVRKNAKDVNKIILGLVKDPSRIPDIVGNMQDELDFFESNKGFLGDELGVQVKVVQAEQSKEAKAGQAMPGKAAVLIK